MINFGGVKLFFYMHDTTKLIRAAWDKRTVYTMTLAYNCWEEGKSVHPDLRKRLEKWLDAALESTDLDIARLAAQVQLSRRLQYAVAGD